MALLVAIQDGWMRLEDPAWRYIPAWQADPSKSAIRLRDLANHSSGIEHARESGDPSDQLSGWKAEYWRHHAKRFHIALHVAPVKFLPGTRISYSGPGYTALSYALSASLRDAPVSDIEELLRTRIMRPLGIPDTHWRIGYGKRFQQDGLRLYLFEGGGRYTARAVARIGELIGQRGTWHAKRILNSELIDSLVRADVATPAPRPAGEPVSALGWWSNAKRTWPHLPDDTLLGVGSGHQVLVVIPSYRLVLVRQGESLGDTRSDKEFWQLLDHSLLRPLAEIIHPAANIAAARESLKPQ
jgi:CubicO group peptidase (beta-lactamase class C family)